MAGVPLGAVRTDGAQVGGDLPVPALGSVLLEPVLNRAAQLVVLAQPSVPLPPGSLASAGMGEIAVVAVPVCGLFALDRGVSLIA